MTYSHTNMISLPFTVVISLGIAFLWFANPGYANQSVYLTDSAGDLVTDGSSECVQTGSWDKALSTPECDAQLAARLEAEKLAEQERLNRQAELAAMEAMRKDPALIRISDSGKVAFSFNSSNLTDATKSELDHVVQMFESYEDIESIDISGHTDSTGPESYNQVLSKNRAESVKQYLVTRGIEPSLISAHGAGELEPIADNASRAGRAVNRRVDLRINGTRVSSQ